MTLPINRTPLTAFSTNAAPENVFASSTAEAAMQEAYDTIDELNSKVDVHSGAITLAHPDGSVTGPKLRDAAVTTAKLADGAITYTKLGDGSVTNSKLAGSITGDKLTDGTIPTAKIADSAVTGPKVATGSLDASKFVAGALTNETQNGLQITQINAQLADIAIDVKYPPAPLVGAKGDGVTNDTAAIQTAINSVDPKRGITLFFPRGKYKLNSLVFDGMNHVRVFGDKDTYIYSLTSGTLFEFIDCRYVWLSDMVITGRNVTDPYQDGQTVVSGVTTPSKAVYIRERSIATRKLQSERFRLENLYIIKATTGIQVGDSSLPNSDHQPSDVTIRDCEIVEATDMIRVDHLNSQGIYVEDFIGSSYTNSFLTITGGDFIGRNIQVSTSTPAAYAFRVLPASDYNVVRFHVENYWNESTSGVLITNQNRVSDSIRLNTKRLALGGVTYPFDIQCKNTDVYLNVESISASTSVSDLQNYLRVNKNAYLRMENTRMTSGGSPRIRINVVDDANTIIDSYAPMGLADKGVPFFTPNPNLVPNAGGPYILASSQVFGDGTTKFKVLRDNTLYINKTGAGVVTGDTNLFAVEAGKDYTLTVLDKTSSTANTSMYYRMQFYDSSGTAIADVDSITTASRGFNDVWNSLRGTYTAPVSAAYARVRIVLNSSTIAQIWVKNLKVEQGLIATGWMPGAYKHVTPSGTTASRPTLTNLDSDLYTPYFDTSIGKPIWWNGSAWKDATGTTV